VTGVQTCALPIWDHGLFTTGGHNPLTFLTVGERTWRWMGEHSGLPNRRLVDWYREETAERGYEAHILVTQAIGEDEEIVPHTATMPASALASAKPLVDEIRPALPPRYRTLPDEDLATAGIFLIARKPGPGADARET